MAEASTFFSLHPFFEGGTVNGRKEANTSFMTELLETDPFDAYHFFVDDPEGLVADWKPFGHLHAFRRKAVRATQRLSLPAALRETRYSVCHLSNPIDHFINIAVARNRLSQEIFPVTAPNHTFSYTSFAPSLAACLWSGWSPRDALGCNSTAARDALRRYFAALGANEEARMPRLEVIPMGAFMRDAGRDAALRRSMRQRLGLNEAAVLLLLFGRISVADKLDPQPLVLALRRVALRRPDLDITLLISGARMADAADVEVLPVLAKKFGIALQLMPDPTVEDKEALFAAADIFVSPSDNVQETFGLTLPEAMAAGLPVIASDWDGYRDIVVHNETGLLVPTRTQQDTPMLDVQAHFTSNLFHHFLRAQSTCVDVPALAEAILTLAADGDLRRRMGQAARRRAREHFSWKVVVERWIRLWEQLRSIPVDDAGVANLRASHHPLHVPFGRIFAGFASAGLEDCAYACTDVGRMLLHGELPWESVTLLHGFFDHDLIRRLLVLARNPIVLHDLRRKNAGIDDETFEKYFLWCLKHDLMARYPA